MSRKDIISLSVAMLAQRGMPTDQAFSWTTQQHDEFVAWHASGGPVPTFVSQS